ncbi:hypothetical protein FKP32DRAFT_1679603 [Trametes sanguinea]|nr:hypothetical protein FKP32DRAFT_1679603 [Trametes sanguinea]
MNRPSLNYDILLNIARFADRRTLRCLMQTCKELYRPAAKLILADGYACLRTLADIRSFLSFLLADPEHRLPLLHRLEIKVDVRRYKRRSRQADSALPALFRRLAESGALTDLILWRAEDLVNALIDIPPTIVALKTLSRLELNDVGPFSGVMLGAMEARLVSVAVKFQEPGLGFPLGGHFNKDPLDLLIRYRRTLRELKMSCAVIPFTQLNANNTPRYENVTTLTLERMHLPSIQLFVYAFPELRRLSVHRCVDEDSFDTDYTQVYEQRYANQEQQRTQGSWPSLESFCGSVYNLHYLGITCPISVLDLTDDCAYDDHIFPMDVVREILLDLHPVELALRVPGIYAFRDKDFHNLCLRPAFQDLRTLKFVASLQDEDGDDDWSSAVGDLVANIIGPLPSLSQFELHLNCDVIIDDSNESDSNEAETPAQRLEKYPLSRLERELADWDPVAFAERAFEASAGRTLKSVTVVQEGHRVREDFKLECKEDPKIRNLTKMNGLRDDSGDAQ